MIRVQEFEALENAPNRNWDIVFVGQTVDERGVKAAERLAKASSLIKRLEYYPDSFELNINDLDRKLMTLDSGFLLPADDYISLIKGQEVGSVALDVTTLGFVEILYALKACFESEIGSVDCIYVEPTGYARQKDSFDRNTKLLHRRDFELTTEFGGFNAIPGATKRLTDKHKQRVVFFVGFEEMRMDRAMEEHPMIKPGNTSVVFGVPAFKSGWEMDSFANNIRVISERKIGGGVYFCSAENPSAVYRKIQEIHEEIEENEELILSPVGTTPMAVGVALYAAINSNVGLLYDHPKWLNERSEGASGCHLFEIGFDD